MFYAFSLCFQMSALIPANWGTHKITLHGKGNSVGKDNECYPNLESILVAFFLICLFCHKCYRIEVLTMNCKCTQAGWWILNLLCAYREFEHGHYSTK